jgi:Ca2+-binding RTX toxin-like protein
MSKRITILLTTVGLLLAFAAGVALARTVTCTGGPCEGTNREDTITGSPQNDTIIAKRGGDTVISNQRGADTVRGGRGGDSINLNDTAGDDFVDCGMGRDDTINKNSGDIDERCEVTTP